MSSLAPPTPSGLPPVGDEALAARYEPLRDCVEAIGADDVITAKEYAFLKQKVSTLCPPMEGETLDSIARHVLRLFAPHAKPDASIALQSRVAKLKPVIEAVCADGVVSLQEVEFLKKKVVELQLVKPGESIEQFIREALAPMAARVKVETAAHQALAGARPGAAGPAAPITVVVTPDGREARALMEKGQRWSPDDVRRALADAGVVHGIDRRWTEARPPLGQPGTTVVLAKATEPGEGAPRTLTWHAPTARAMAFELESERLPVTFDVDTFVAPIVVEAGALLATLSATDVGAPGTSVRGAVLPGLPGAAPDLFAGAGVRFSDDGLELRAELRGGLTVSERGVVEVLPVHEVPADVSGIVDVVHAGAVVVRGDLGTSSRVVATGDVVIDGFLEGGTVRSGGNVIVRGGMFRKANVRAAMDVVVRRLEGDSSVEAGGNVFVLADAIGSRIDGGSFVAVLGTVTGGVVRSRTSVEADAFALGRASEMTVEVRVPGAMSPAALRTQLEALAQEAAKARGALATVGAEAGASKLVALKPAGSPPARVPLGGAPRAPAAVRVPSPGPRTSPAGAPVNADVPPRVPIASPNLLSGDDLPAITTAGSLRIDLREDEATIAEVEMSFVRNRLALLDETVAPMGPRILCRSSVAAGIRVNIEGETRFFNTPMGDVLCTLVDGQLVCQSSDMRGVR